MNNMTINERIIYLRKNKLHMTQATFSKKINISRSNLSSIENGRVKATERLLTDICRVFKVNGDWLMCGNQEIFKNITLKSHCIDQLSNEDDVAIKILNTLIVMYNNLSYSTKQEINEVLSKTVNILRDTNNENLKSYICDNLCKYPLQSKDEDEMSECCKKCKLK